MDSDPNICNHNPLIQNELNVARRKVYRPIRAASCSAVKSGWISFCHVSNPIKPTPAKTPITIPAFCPPLSPEDRPPLSFGTTLPPPPPPPPLGGGSCGGDGTGTSVGAGAADEPGAVPEDGVGAGAADEPGAVPGDGVGAGAADEPGAVPGDGAGPGVIAWSVLR
ncbi:hypothetical protein L1987_35023 [Smallanthus sonchifolius]|uniref:Uncharacterized protein n=1 Tax=Smallanthus sonchifolius TaxID=185202 RepID=A0ACB9HVA9_9ASTR|nr:hypothetical protein L1987_35023 [Smallanthus sonchifolius]